MNNLLNKKMLVSAAMGGLLVLALAAIVGAAGSTTNSNNSRFQTTAVGSESFIITDGVTGQAKVYTLKPVGSSEPVLVRATLNP